jgi:hypothetical protein
MSAYNFYDSRNRILSDCRIYGLSETCIVQKLSDDTHDELANGHACEELEEVEKFFAIHPDGVIALGWGCGFLLSERPTRVVIAEEDGGMAFGAAVLNDCPKRLLVLQDADV